MCLYVKYNCIEEFSVFYTVGLLKDFGYFIVNISAIDIPSEIFLFSPILNGIIPLV